RRARLSVATDQIDVELHRTDSLGAGELRVPVLVVPAAAEGVDHRVERGEYFAPAGFAAQADTGGLAGRVQGGGVSGDLLPGGFGRHLQAGLFEQVLAVHEERRFTVERDRIHTALVGQRSAQCRDEI